MVFITASKHHLLLIDQLYSPCPKTEVIGVTLDAKLGLSVILLLQLNLAESLACIRRWPQKADLMTGGTYWNSINAPW